MKIETNKIHQMDCLKGLELMDKKSVDVIVTSPPYNIGVSYNKYNDNKSREDYLEWLYKVGKGCKRVLADNGSFFLNVGNKPSNQYNVFEIVQKLRELFELQNTIHWIKSIAIPREDVGDYPHIQGDIAVGHYKPINSPRFLTDCHEYILHFTKNKNVELDDLAVGVPYQDKSNIGRWESASEDLRSRGNAWFIPYKTIWSRRKQRPHPSTFPIKLPEMCIKLHGVDKTNLVLDPFMGIGTTAIACQKLGIDYIGFEIDKRYIRIAKKNYETTSGAPLGDKLISGGEL